MAYNTLAERPQKDKARDLLLQSKVIKSPAKAAIFLPSIGAQCVKTALEKSKIDKSTKIIAIERDINLVPQVKKALSELGIKNFIVINDDAHNITESEVKKFIGNTKISFAFFDFCGSQTLDTMIWVKKITNSCFASKAHIAFTYQVSPRGGHFFTLGEKHGNPTEYERCFDLLNETISEEAEGYKLSDNYNTVMLKAEWNVWLAIASVSIKYQHVFNEDVIVYRDTHTNMIGIAFDCEVSQRHEIKQDEFYYHFVNNLVYNTQNESVIDRVRVEFNITACSLEDKPKYMTNEQWAVSKYNKNSVIQNSMILSEYGLKNSDPK